MVGADEAVHGGLQPVLEVVSVGAEVLAFFLVTTDLYGEQRLAALQQRLSSWTRSLIVKLRFFDFGKQRDLTSLGSPIGFVVRGLIVVGIVLLLPHIAVQLASELPWIVRTADQILMVVLVFTMGCGLLLLPIDIICLMPRVALWLLRKAGMKHLLLGIGVLLFLLSKGLLVFTILHDFSRPLAPW